MRITTKDLAEHLELSRATVDRVLNKRGGVSDKTVQKVLSAVEELGFKRNTFASNLARNKIYRFLFLLPDHHGEFVTEISKEIKELSASFKADNIDISLKLFSIDNRNETLKLLSEITSESCDGVAIMSPDSPRIRDALSRLEESGVSVVRFISGKSVDSVGIDNYSAGATAARLLGNFCKPHTGHILVVSEDIKSGDSVKRRNGFDNTMQSYFPNLKILPTVETYNDSNKTTQIFSNINENNYNIVGIYILGHEAAHVLTTINQYEKFKNTIIVAHENTPTTIDNLKQGTIDALVTHRTIDVLFNTIKLLKEQCDNSQDLDAIKDINIEILLKENLPIKNN